jgi:hypothetical protein
VFESVEECLCSQNLSSWKFVDWCGSRESRVRRVDSDRRYIANSIKMIPDDSTTSVSSMATLFMARRRSGRIITMLPEASVGPLATSDAKAMKAW